MCFRRVSYLSTTRDMQLLRATVITCCPRTGDPDLHLWPNFSARVARPGSVAEQGVHECLGLERRQVVRTLAESDELDRNVQCPLHGDDDAALGGSVQLCLLYTSDAADEEDSV